MRFPVNSPYEITQGYKVGHLGLDIAPRPAGTKVPLYATVNGVIQTRNSGKIEGNYLFLQGDDGFFYYYGHLDSFSVALNQRVVEGQQVGIMGTTGQSTGVHCHVEVRTQRVGGNINPTVHFKNASKGDDEVKIGSEDNWRGRFNRLHRQLVRNADMSDPVFKSIQGSDAWKVVESWSDHPEADTLIRYQEVGENAVKDNWVGQIQALQAALTSVQEALKNEQAKPPKEIVKEVEKIVEKPIEVEKIVLVHDEETKENVNQILKLVKTIRGLVLNLFKKKG